MFIGIGERRRSRAGCGRALLLCLAAAGCSDRAMPTYSGQLPSEAGLALVTLNVSGSERTVAAYRPTGLASGRPLLLVFHETGGDAADALSSSGAIELADREGLVLVAPQARALAAGDWDDHVAGQRYFETHPNLSPSTNGDLQLVTALISLAGRDLGSDAKRVYTFGFSNGAFFATFAALTLPGQIAGFAEAGGGLVTCATSPSCRFAGSGASCAELAAEPGYCSCSGEEKPAPLPSSGRKPAGYLAHGRGDTTVSPYYTCALAARMQALGYPNQVSIVEGDHRWPPGFATSAWSFLQPHVLP